MGFIKDKYFFWGILTGVLWTGFGVLILLFFLSNKSIEDSLISISALINLPVFFIALQKNKFAFAAGLVAISLVLVLLVAFLKLNN